MTTRTEAEWKEREKLFILPEDGESYEVFAARLALLDHEMQLDNIYGMVQSLLNNINYVIQAGKIAGIETEIGPDEFGFYYAQVGTSGEQTPQTLVS